MGSLNAGEKVSALCLILLFSSWGRASGTTFSAFNNAPSTPGGQRFENEIGVEWTVNMLQSVQSFIIGQFSLSLPRQVDHVSWYLEDIGGAAGAFNNDIKVSASWLNTLAPPNDANSLKFELQGVMYHEMTHNHQNNLGDYSGDVHFAGIIEGIATWMELRAGFGIGPKVKGSTWYDGYANTAYFLDWIESTQIDQFVNRLNQRMGLLTWNDDFFLHITGKDVNTLWYEYPA